MCLGKNYFDLAYWNEIFSFPLSWNACWLGFSGSYVIAIAFASNLVPSTPTLEDYVQPAIDLPSSGKHYLYKYNVCHVYCFLVYFCSMLRSFFIWHCIYFWGIWVWCIMHYSEVSIFMIHLFFLHAQNICLQWVNGLFITLFLVFQLWLWS